MAAPLLDNEFPHYWSKLTVAKNYIQSKTDEPVSDDLRKKLVL
jgi:hypothetical protein